MILLPKIWLIKHHVLIQMLHVQFTRGLTLEILNCRLLPGYINVTTWLSCSKEISEHLNFIQLVSPMFKYRNHSLTVR